MAFYKDSHTNDTIYHLFRVVVIPRNVFSNLKFVNIKEKMLVLDTFYDVENAIKFLQKKSKTFARGGLLKKKGTLIATNFVRKITQIYRRKGIKGHITLNRNPPKTRTG